jgi:hypothetical protein
LNKHKGTSYKSVDEAIQAGEPIKNTPIYTNTKGEDVTDKFNAASNVPMKQPGVWQRLLNPSAAQRETDINTQYNLNKEQPYLSNLSGLDVGSKNIALGRNAGTNLSSAIPLFVSALTGGNATAAAQRSAQQNVSDMANNVPQLESSAEANRLALQPATDTEASRRYMAGSSLFNQNLTNDMNQASQLTPFEQKIQGTRDAGAWNRLPNENEALNNEVKDRLLNSRATLDINPTVNATRSNEALSGLYNSQFGNLTPPYANRVNSDGSITPNVATGSTGKQWMLLRGLLNDPNLIKSLSGAAPPTPSGVAISKSGKKIPQPPDGINSSVKLPKASLPMSMQDKEAAHFTTFNEDGSITIGGKKYIPEQ